MKKTIFVFVLQVLGICAYAQKYSYITPSGQTLYFSLYDNYARITYPGNNSSSPYNGFTEPYGTLVIPDSVIANGIKYPVKRIMTKAFYDCDNLTSVSIPNAVDYIGDQSFYDCNNLSSVNIPDSIKSIGTSAFEHCGNISSIDFPNKSFGISYGSFGYCGIRSLTLPPGINSIQENAFRYCDSLTNVYYNIDSLYYTINGGLFEYCSNLDTFIIGSNVRVIPQYLLKNCTGLTSITIPDNIKSIGNYAFVGCNNLMIVNLNSDSLFLHNTTGADAYKSVFANCSTLTTLNIGSNVTRIENDSFKGCSSLVNVNIAGNLNRIGMSAFEDCISLISFNCPPTVSYLGAHAFQNCSSLSSFNIPNISKIYSQTFDGCGLDSVTIPPSVTQIGIAAFAHCRNMVYAYIPSSVTSMEASVFGKCNSLSTVHYNATNCAVAPSVIYNGTHYGRTFDSCLNLTNVYIGDSVTVIPDYFFDSCIALNNITLPSGLSSIGSYSFSNCLSLDSLVIPQNVSNIGTFAFANCTALQRMALPNDITTISAGLFDGCLNLDSVIFGDSIISIGAYAFRNCNSLLHFNMPENITAIEDHVFEGCGSLSSITIPQSVSSIGEGSFSYCNNLNDIYILSITPPIISNNPNYWIPWNSDYYRLSFYGMQDHATFHVPCGTSNAYYNAWSYHYSYSEPIVTFDFSVASSDSVVGSVSMIQDIICQDSSVVIQATLLNSNYHFSSWSNGNTANPDTLYLDGDSTVTAIFERNIYTVIAHSNDTSMGYVEGGDTYLYQDTVQLIAVPLEYYHFVQWSDGSIENPRQWVVVTDTQFTAFFEADTFQLNVISNNNTQGVVSGSGTFPYGIPVTINATANTGYHFTHWSNGNINNPDTLYLISDSTITAFFERNQYILTVQSNNTSFGEVEGGGSYLYQDTAFLVATANDTYHFVHWSDGNTDNPRQFIVTGNATLTATFAIDTFHVNVASNNIAYGGVSGEGDYQYGTPATIIATAYTGYHFSQWSNGITANPYTFAVLQDTELTAIFVEDGTQGIDNISSRDVHVYQYNGKIVVSGIDKESIYLYDIYGRLLITKQAEYSQSLLDIPSSGLYLVKVGNHPAKKIVVIR